MKVEELQQLVTAQDKAQRQAATIAREAHEKALEAAQALRKELEGATDQLAQREALKAIIEAAAGRMYASKTDKQQAGLLAQQYALERAAAPGAGHSVARDGTYLMRTVVSSTSSGYQPEERARIYGAMVVGATGGADTGLMRWGDDWSQEVSIAYLNEMAQALDAEGTAKLDAEQAKLDAELTQVCRMEQALEQATPRLFVVKESEEPSTVVVRNHRGGSVGVGGVTFASGDNSIPSHRMDKLRANSGFQAHVEDGNLEIVSTSELVEGL
ncbi:hypothetical protein [uncultured Halomonas sp.]|uniref:hypothetical protein n=1 Tax=uncultured Halomonas sp. TaxID=173971 RepID=UPI0026233DB8|nr:hypothetical protein [uncultured Halomonas sp.]